MTLASAGGLIAFVQNGPWRGADADTRFEVLSLVDTAIIKLREHKDMAPFDDALPFSDEPLTAFEQIREILG